MKSQKTGLTEWQRGRRESAECAAHRLLARCESPARGRRRTREDSGRAQLRPLRRYSFWRDRERAAWRSPSKLGTRTVSMVRSVDLPTDGKPMRATLP